MSQLELQHYTIGAPKPPKSSHLGAQNLVSRNQFRTQCEMAISNVSFLQKNFAQRRSKTRKAVAKKTINFEEEKNLCSQSLTLTKIVAANIVLLKCQKVVPLISLGGHHKFGYLRHELKSLKI